MPGVIRCKCDVLIKQKIRFALDLSVLGRSFIRQTWSNIFVFIYLIVCSWASAFSKTRLLPNILIGLTALGVGNAASGVASPMVPSSPFADLPSTPGSHILEIRKMPANSWLEIGPPAADPDCGSAVGRSWGSKMPFAPVWRGAFLFGEGKHGAYTERNGKRYYNDDLFFYDLNAHKWLCLYPGTEIGAYELSINDDGFEVNQMGHPVPVASMVHSYAMLTYDEESQVLWHMWSPSGYWRKWFPERKELIEKNRHRLNGLGPRWSDVNRASPWGYDTNLGHWIRYRTEMDSPKIGHGSHLIYLYRTQELLYLRGSNLHSYDIAENQWQSLEPVGPPPPRPGDAPSCYDSKRDRIYVAMGSYPRRARTAVEGNENRLWAYDVSANAWIDLKPGGLLRPKQVRRPGGSNLSLLHCNRKDDIVLYLARERDRGLHIYSPKNNEWLLTEPIKLPANWGNRRPHGFYDPELNVHFFFVASSGKTDGSIFVYRYGL